jgi:cellulose synthase/poly-beta-1,6-N-acetylglucosamine synthase-like glycosyltransferase
MHGTFRNAKEQERDAETLERAILLNLGWTETALAALAQEALSAQSGLIATAIAKGDLDASAFYESLARVLAFAGDATVTGGSEAERPVPLPWKLIRRGVPFRLRQGAIGLNAQAVTVDTLPELANRLGDDRRRVCLLTRQAAIDTLSGVFAETLTWRAVNELYVTNPGWSAKSGLSKWQAVALAVMAGLAAGALPFLPGVVATALTLALSLTFAMAVGLRLSAAVHLMRSGTGPRQPPPVPEHALPHYTVFIPLFREAAILPHLAKALRDLDYPPAKLDIKIVLESVDSETLAVAQTLSFPGNVDLIVVPDSEPRTKPKALNYALQFATGDLAVIYDAEDRPEPDQLRKAAAHFAAASPDVACLQARLDYFNARENWLSRQFTIEYAALFRGLLPFLARHDFPVPLGGTSNHFRLDVLRSLKAWDPYNVTEDADLGMRLRRAGYRIEMLDSTTYEEACCQLVPWIKQRTRWLKGWMQTLGVHTREPVTTMREIGPAGFMAFHAYLAGIVLSALAHPVFLALMMLQAATGTLMDEQETELVYALALSNFIGGYAANLLLAWLSVRRAQWKALAWHVIFIPVYWLLISAAAYRAVWQLVTAPYYWDKTEHGVSKHL